MEVSGWNFCPKHRNGSVIAAIVNQLLRVVVRLHKTLFQHMKYMVVAATVGIHHMEGAGSLHHEPQDTLTGVAHTVQDPVGEQLVVMNTCCHQSAGIHMQVEPCLLHHGSHLLHMGDFVAFLGYLVHIALICRTDLMMHKLVFDHQEHYP